MSGQYNPSSSYQNQQGPVVIPPPGDPQQGEQAPGVVFKNYFIIKLTIS